MMMIIGLKKIASRKNNLTEDLNGVNLFVSKKYVEFVCIKS